MAIDRYVEKMFLGDCGYVGVGLVCNQMWKLIPEIIIPNKDSNTFLIRKSNDPKLSQSAPEHIHTFARAASIVENTGKIIVSIVNNDIKKKLSAEGYEIVTEFINGNTDNLIALMEASFKEQQEKFNEVQFQYYNELSFKDYALIVNDNIYYIVKKPQKKSLRFLFYVKHPDKKTIFALTMDTRITYSAGITDLSNCPDDVPTVSSTTVREFITNDVLYQRLNEGVTK